MRHSIALFGSALLVMAGWAPAQDTTELELDHSVNTDIVSPHTAWAKPYALGTSRVLFFTWGRGTDPREVIELKQRFDIDPQMVFWARIVDSTQEGWHGGDLGVQRILRLLGEKWDTFVFIGIPVERLPTEAQYRLLKQVTDGAGLVLCGTEDKRLFKPQNQVTDLPGFLADGPVGSAYQIKDGRGILLPAKPSIEYTVGWDVLYDAWQQRLGKAVLWAAGKAPQLELGLERPAAEVQSTTLPGAVSSVKWQTAQLPPDLKLDVRLRRWDGTVLALPAIPATRAQGTAPIAAPALCAGVYHLDVIARSARGTEAFTSAEFAVVSPRQVAELVLDRDWAEIGEKLTGTVKLAGPRAGAGERLVLSLFDRRGRELVRQELDSTPEAVLFSLDVTDRLPMLLRVQATLVNGQQEIASAWRFARVTKRHRGQFNFVMWDRPTGSLAAVGEESLAKSGITTHLSGGNPAPVVAAYDLAWVPYTTRILAARDDKGVMKPACWHDEAGIQAHVDGIVKKYEDARKHGVFVYSLGDEGDVRGSCFAPSCLAAYQRYLQEQYGDIKALNESWGTTFAGFDQINLTKADDNDEAEALRAGNLPRWFDRQAFQSDGFCKLCERFGNAFRALDPQSKCGFEGAGTFQAADDLDGFVRANTFWSPYPGTADEVVRSIAPREFPRANWMGYTKDADTLLEKYWRMVTRGCDSVWWWRWDCIGRFHGWLSPTLDPYPAVKDILADTQIVRDGLGDLLLKYEMLDDGVGILFSQPSAYACRVQTGPSFGSYESDHVAWHKAIRDLGLNFRYVTDRMLRLGEFKPEQFRVLILPFTQAVGPKEAEVLREYVRNGGVLVADVRPAIYDGHLKALATGALDDVFGIRRTGAGEAVIADGTAKGDLGGTAVATGFTKIRADGGIETAGATALGAAGKTPLVLVNTFGKGRAVLLNFALNSAPPLDSEQADDSYADMVRALFNLAGVKPAMALAAGEKRLRNIEVTRWRNGSIEIVSIFRHQGKPDTARVTLGEAARVYDLKGGRDLGSVSAFDLTVTPYRAQFYALLRAESAPLQVAVDKPEATPGQVLTARITAPQAQGLQAVRVRVKTPEGQPAEWLDRVVLADATGTAFPLPIAWNDPRGMWTVEATELFTRKVQTATFAVK
ncbi:MAG: hypothetical protein A3K19_06165 [Lentisphaerae bacterium RIFOXYB12_FULL_65_16]|nr:MAG: hypothetical protein A3K18_34765 [Lentisphaerae bacterium RIFOXYA12_64_32]OGV94056.1 MAG: hypothetical protein A3K19_06165 [Lentisphaerae bacterium RIFOXYB12_FULL_65_16]